MKVLVAVRQHAIAALNLVQQAKQTVNEAGRTYITSADATNPSTTNSNCGEATNNTALRETVECINVL